MRRAVMHWKNGKIGDKDRAVSEMLKLLSNGFGKWMAAWTSGDVLEDQVKAVTVPVHEGKVD